MKWILPILVLVGMILVVGASTAGILGTLAVVAALLVILLPVIYLRVRNAPYGNTSTSDRVRNVWLKQGLIYGIILGILLIPWSAQDGLTLFGSLPGILNYVVPTISQVDAPLMIVMASFTAARKSGKALQGTFAGLLSSLVGSAIAIGALVLILWLFWDTALSNAMHDPNMLEDFHNRTDTTFGQFVWDDSLGGAFFLTISTLLQGLLLGAIGGFLGANWPGEGSLVKTGTSQSRNS